MHRANFKIKRDDVTGVDWHFSTPLELCHFGKKRRSSVTCFSCRLLLSVVQSLQTMLHSLQWRLMVSWPTGEKCQISPQLHSKAKSQSGHRHQRSPMMWLDPAQSMDAGSWPLSNHVLNGIATGQMVKRKDKNESEQWMWEWKSCCLE